MKISDLTDDELSRWIAEKLEPLPIPFHDGITGHSPMKYWSCIDYWLPVWQPRDMVNDPEMTVMLMKDMIKRDPEAWLELSGVVIENGTDTIGRAVAEAFALANGWKE